MNLYGDIGNVFILCHHLKKCGVNVTLEKKSLKEKIIFSEYNAIYIGSGTERNQKIALHNLKNYRDEILKTIERGTPFLATGNSFEVFGSKIHSASGEIFDGLSILKFDTTEYNDKRIAENGVYETEFCSEPLVGFINTCSEIRGIDNHLLKVKMGPGDFPNSLFEGVRYFNFFGTHLIGPILVRNPYFLKKFIEIIDKDNNLKNRKIKDIYAIKSYELTLNSLKV
jgi:CobQ-like glutamine amidotransferase family enzyme